MILGVTHAIQHRFCDNSQGHAAVFCLLWHFLLLTMHIMYAMESHHCLPGIPNHSTLKQVGLQAYTIW